MPRNSFGLTGFRAASKLFFIASQRALPLADLLRIAPTMDVETTRTGQMTFNSAIYRCTRDLGLLLIGLLLITIPAIPAAAQSPPAPTREQLLNGLPVLFWQRPGDANVYLKLRLNSGAAFDLTGKAGMMALLGEALFPDPATREYVTEELGGRLEVSTNYDSIEITIAGRASELERLVELMRNAIITINLSADNVNKLRDARIAQLKSTTSTPAQLADRAVAQRLFGSFPYARPIEGDNESLPKIERADLMLAQERFLHSENAALAVIGGAEKARVMRTLRQLLGPWQKGDRSIAQTFRQPTAPDERVLLINQAGAQSTEVRLALRGLARTDRDALAASVLAQIARERWQTAVPELAASFVRHEAHTLPGMFVFGASAPVGASQKAFTAAQDVMKGLAQTGVSAAELDRAKGSLSAQLKKTNELDTIADAWLDTEVYKGLTPADPAAELARLTVNDIQRVASRLFKDVVIAKVALGDGEQLKPLLGANIELPKSKDDVKPATIPQPPPKKP